MTNNKKYSSRKWLSPSTTAFIFTELEFDYGWGASLKIGDCNRVVRLDVFVDDEKARKKALKKLNLLRNELTNLITAIEGISYGQ